MLGGADRRIVRARVAHRKLVDVIHRQGRQKLVDALHRRRRRERRHLGVPTRAVLRHRHHHWGGAAVMRIRTPCAQVSTQPAVMAQRRRAARRWSSAQKSLELRVGNRSAARTRAWVGSASGAGAGGVVKHERSGRSECKRRHSCETPRRWNAWARARAAGARAAGE